jgi:hypothetical protein
MEKRPPDLNVDIHVQKIVLKEPPNSIISSMKKLWANDNKNNGGENTHTLYVFFALTDYYNSYASPQGPYEGCKHHHVNIDQIDYTPLGFILDKIPNLENRGLRLTTWSNNRATRGSVPHYYFLALDVTESEVSTVLDNKVDSSMIIAGRPFECCLRNAPASQEEVLGNPILEKFFDDLSKGKAPAYRWTDEGTEEKIQKPNPFNFIDGFQPLGSTVVATRIDERLVIPVAQDLPDDQLTYLGRWALACQAQHVSYELTLGDQENHYFKIDMNAFFRQCPSTP